MDISMIVDLSSGLKERDAVSTLSATEKGGGSYTYTHTYTSPLIGREMQSGAL